MNTTAPTSSPDQFAIVDGSGATVDNSPSNHEALQIVDWYNRHEPADGPYRVIPRIPEQHTGH